ncbi:MAG: GNAT family N-acetyltransferase [Cycloclasticus sp.]|nr:GNAT family N-acetyltransferase [Cycloclasticus sp.]
MPNNARFSVKTGDWLTTKHLAKPIRLSVFVKEQGVPANIELDPLDPDCQHFIALDEQARPIATARLGVTGKLGRMAVLKAYRRKGAGRLLLDAVNVYAISQGLHRLTCHAQTEAAGFYKKQGFVTTGMPFQEAGIEHLKMVKVLSA